jgi:hypothetical protein
VNAKITLHIPLMLSNADSAYTPPVRTDASWPQYSVAPPKGLNSLFVKQYLSHA